MYCRVVPLTRTPPGVEVFDYRVPPTLKLEVGDLVLVPFRRSKMPAIVLAKMQSSPFASKAQDVIGSYADIRFPLSIVELLSHVATTTFTSKPAVLKAWLRSLPKRIPDVIPANAGIQRKKSKPSVTASWSIDHESKLIERARELLADGKQALVLTPWKARLTMFVEEIGQGSIYSSDLNDGDAFRAWSRFYSGESRLVVATRLGGWLSPLADVVLLDEPENDDYKQDELAPRYDARKLAIWSAEHASTVVEAYGLTPPLHSDEDAPAIEVDLEVVIRHPQGRGAIPMIQGEALNTLREHEGARIIIHPIKGDVARLTCRDCGHQVICPKCDFVLAADGMHARCRRCGYKGDLPLECPSCHGPDLGKSLPGIERLKSAWKKHESDIEVEWRGVSNADFEMPIPEHACVLVTDASLISGGSEDVRRLEKLAVTFRRLAHDVALSKGKLLIQTEEHMADFWTRVLSTEGFKGFREQERAARHMFGYPPAKRLIKVIVEFEDEKPLAPIKALAEVRGPYPIPYRVKTKKNRYIWHILPKTNTVSRELLDALSSLSKQALIDLDPIAFLR
ncbi:hypothetical protein IPH19_01195 [Candidatus Uhrbacteria bacterium]|nr:MAG: hypothetical protein IPH19_01195 [Candidatus Uhrbacteria bacterium]